MEHAIKQAVLACAPDPTPVPLQAAGLAPPNTGDVTRGVRVTVGFVYSFILYHLPAWFFYLPGGMTTLAIAGGLIKAAGVVTFISRRALPASHS
jgi:hypothetical protein